MQKVQFKKEMIISGTQSRGGANNKKDVLKIQS